MLKKHCERQKKEIEKITPTLPEISRTGAVKPSLVEFSDQEADDTQREILDLVKQGKNILITGQAGTGKSFLLSKIKSILTNKYSEKSKNFQTNAVAVTSTTGISADIIGGTTLASFTGMKAYDDFPYSELLTVIARSKNSRGR